MIDPEMKLPDGKKCSDCAHFRRCARLFGAKPDNTGCDFHPIRFVQQKQEQAPILPHFPFDEFAWPKCSECGANLICTRIHEPYCARWVCSGHIPTSEVES